MMCGLAAVKEGGEVAWVSVHDNVIGGKLRELAKEMGCTQEEALGILVSLWIWSLNNADKDGKLMSVDREDVLEAFSMKLVSGLKVDLVDTLVKTRWMDEPEPGVLYIHDWDQWQEQWYKAMERREKDAKRKAESRRAGAARKPAPARKPAASPEPGGGAEPSDGEGTTEKPKELAYTTAFEEFWAAYPRKIGKGEAYKKYQTRRKDGFSDAELLEAAKNYALDCAKRKTEKEYIKHPKTFLSDNLPFTDYLPKKKPEEPQGLTGNENPFKEWGDDT